MGRTAAAGRTLIHLADAVGVDEAGRGPLAGPVVAAAAWLPEDFDVDGLDDSKKLTREARESLAMRIRERAEFAIAIGSLEAIERLNILHATMAAMAQAVFELKRVPDQILIDGNRVPDPLRGRAEAVVEGDGKYACVAAASILAKTERDRLMAELAREYPEYGFDRHFGYGTPEHLEALRRFGPCPIHRRSFGPCQIEEQPCLMLDP